jgi:hypothetical protein
VYDDLTFYKLLILFKKDLESVKVNFYEFKCIGFNYKHLIFKQKEIQPIAKNFNYKEKYCYTYGGYALNLLVDLISKNTCKATKIDPALKIKIRAGYVGGRNEYIADPLSNHKLYSIDFNMMYYNCLKTEFLCGQIVKKQTDCFKEPGFYYITYESLNKEYPVLFVKNVKNEQGYFCNGIGEGLFWHEEVQIFVREGGIIHKIHYVYTGEFYEPNFTFFIDEISKLEDKKLRKLLANNLYGRLAMKDYIYPTKLATDLEFFLKCEKGLVRR